MLSFPTWLNNKFNLKTMEINSHDLLKLDELSDISYARQMKRLFKVILNASNHETRSIQCRISLLSIHGSRRQSHLKLSRLLNIRCAQLQRRQQQQQMRKESWWPFNLIKKNNSNGAWQYSNIMQFREAMQKQQQQFRYAMDRFKQRHSNQWKLLNDQFSQPLYANQFCEHQLQYWLTKIKPKQDNFLNERMKVRQQWFEKVQYQKWLSYLYQQQKSKRCQFKNNEQFSKDIQSWYGSQFELFIGTITNWLLQQSLQMANQSKATLMSKQLEQQRQYYIRKEVTVYFELKIFIRQRKGMKEAFRSKQWFQLRPRLLPQIFKKLLYMFEKKREQSGKMVLQQHLLPAQQKEQ